MKLALIPPNRMIRDTHRTGMQLMLPAEMNRSGMYNVTYSQHLSEGKGPDKRQFVIMDNGAAEAEGAPMATVMDYIRTYKPNEAAIPDELASSEDTIDLALRFLDIYGHELDSAYSKVRLGLVAQGTSVEEAFRTVTTVIGHSDFQYLVKTIYIPRLLVTKDHVSARLALQGWLYETYGKQFEYHFFGASMHWPMEFKEVAAMRTVRSMDTSMPYQLGIAGVDLEKTTGVDVSNVRRPRGYFHYHMSPDQIQRSKANVNYMMEVLS